MAVNNLKSEYDIIFAGGGTAACVTASRLAKADPTLSILLIEQGRSNVDDPAVATPAMFLSHLAPDSKTVLFNKTKKEADLADRELIVASGGMLGGASSINFMMYTRASSIDFDSWKTEGWDGKTLTALANKAENHQLAGAMINNGAHGHGGPIQVTYGTHLPKNNYDDLFGAAEVLGIPHTDVQDFQTGHGFERWAKYISSDGRRQDTAHCYLHPLMQSGECPNLHVLTDSLVRRIKFDGIRAVGVEYEPTATPGGTAPVLISAKKQVVVAAGALNTPLVLERSGVGNGDLLRKHRITVVSDLPGDSFDELLTGREDFGKAMAEGSSKMAWNALDVGGKLRPTEEEVTQLGPVFQECWERDFKHLPSRPLMLVAFFNGYFGDVAELGESSDDHAYYMTAGTYTAYPYARGSVHIASDDARAPSDFATGYLRHPADLAKQVWAYKKQREIMRRTDKYAGEVAARHPAFPAGSRAACRDGPAVEGGFGGVEARAALSPIEYSKEDDQAIEDWIRSHLETAWHSIGTCKMAPREQGGVVDENLNVYGTQGLKVADLSIAPENVGANTYNTAIIVGEKAAQIIDQELGLTVE
ncbi:hypothetical protein NLG97_g9422 [Lecanicillium saksenae]|uniref:Uncharacterized protein n=1 Tax=Lecanicillium saksenae TaxID=468837 RepID=A0ACC1QHW6_9HYPO|nr:hypothetical protein NLG97_g9422 [Lecanicillium saksenae]